MKQLLVCLALLSLCACKSGQPEGEALEVIPLASAFENQTELKASDCFSRVRYVALETTDDCLVGDEPVVRIAPDKIIVMTSQRQCFAFDKQTGKFLHPIGHVGDDPEGCADLCGYYNYAAGQISFPSNRYQELMVYDLEGGFVGRKKEQPMSLEGEIAMVTQDYWDAQTSLLHVPATRVSPEQVFFMRDTTVVAVYPTNSEPASEHAPRLGMPNVMTFENQGTAGHSLMILLYEGECGRVMSFLLSPFWHLGKDTYLKVNFNDTIYRVTQEGLLPERLVDVGAYRFELEDRLYKERDKGFYFFDISENKRISLLRFCRYLYHTEKRTAYNAVYDKATKTVKVAPYDAGITNDLSHFLPLQPHTANEAGEFAQLIQAADVATWFEENASAGGLPADVEALRKVGEEDNPVIAIME